MIFDTSRSKHISLKCLEIYAKLQTRQTVERRTFAFPKYSASHLSLKYCYAFLFYMRSVWSISEEILSFKLNAAFCRASYDYFLKFSPSPILLNYCCAPRF